MAVLPRRILNGISAPKNPVFVTHRLADIVFFCFLDMAVHIYPRLSAAAGVLAARAVTVYDEWHPFHGISPGSFLIII